MDFSTVSLPALLTGSTEAVWVTDSIIWIIVVGFLIAFVLSFAVGANDVANSFGTTVGAKVLTLKQACLLATIFETTGAVLLGAKVGETIRKGIIDVATYENLENGAVILMLGELSAMFGSAAWQLIATVFKVPVSGTHSIVGACIGFSLVAAGTNGVDWSKLGLIVGSWFLSPVLSGVMTIALFALINRLVLQQSNALKNGLRLLPIFYSFTIGINVFSILYSGAPMLGLDHLLLWQILLIAIGFMLLTGAIVLFVYVPRFGRKIKKQNQEASNFNSRADTSFDKFTTGPDSGYDTPVEKYNTSLQTSIDSGLVQKVDVLQEESDNEKQSPDTSLVASRHSSDDNHQTSLMELGKLKKDESDEKCSDSGIEEADESPVIRNLFSPLQVLTACFASFAHGGNDVSNAIGPLIALWMVFWSGDVDQKAFTPWYLLLYGGLGICIGLWTLGRRVIETIGSNLTKVTPSRGFCVELMTAITVLIASNVGLPVSTTHCKVGAVVSIGWWRSRAAVDWKLVGNIALAWFITVPVSGLFSAGVMWVLMQVAL